MMNPNDPKPPELSIVVLTYNRKHLLSGCLETLIGQDYPPEKLEIIVVDDGSNDGTDRMVSAMMAGHPMVQYVRQAHQGIAVARNNGIKHAAGELIAFMADDYLIPPHYARRVCAFFHDYPLVGVVRFRIAAAGNDLMSRIHHLYYEVSINNRLYTKQHVKLKGIIHKIKRSFERIPTEHPSIIVDHTLEAAGGAVFRRAVFDRVGLFDVQFQRAEDTDMGERLKAHNVPFYFCSDLQIRHRYEHSFLYALKKNYLSGIGRYQCQKKFEKRSASVWSTLKDYLNRMFVMPLWRARQADSVTDFFLFLPFLYALEYAVLLGIWTGFVRGKLSRFRVPAGPKT